MAYQAVYTPVPSRVAYLSTRLGNRAHLSVIRGGRTSTVGGYPRRLGQSSSDIGNLIGMGAGTAANAILPGSGTVVTPLVDSIAQVFGSDPVTGPNAERRSKMYGYYATAMTAPGSPSSVCAVKTLYAISLQQFDPCQHLQQNNPQATRTFAQEALQALASQGWIGVNGPNPQYIGVPQSGAIYAPGAQGQQQVVAQAPVPTTATGLALEAASDPLGFLTSNPAILVGGGVLLALLISGRSSSSAKAA